MTTSRAFFQHPHLDLLGKSSSGKRTPSCTIRWSGSGRDGKTREDNLLEGASFTKIASPGTPGTYAVLVGVETVVRFFLSLRNTPPLRTCPLM